MLSITCPDCLQHFSRKDVMLRHRRHKHMESSREISHAYPQSTEAYPPPPPQGTEACPTPPPPPPPQSNEACPLPQSTVAYTPPPIPPQSTEMFQLRQPPQNTETCKPSPLQQNTDVYPLPSPQGAKIDSDIKPMILYQPFTMMTSGPTGCGKTTFVKDLLQHHESRIQHTIERIVWLYKRWQPLYSVLQTSVMPRVQFRQGIPQDLDDDDFFDPKLNNLLVLDDLFAEAAKDKHITGLFTEGSHHRSLSVICINQNLFGTRDTTLQRNTQYLIIFKTPIDSQAIMTLARQMYPGGSDVFLNTFAKATKAPYGYMLVDLKPFTPEKQRLQHKVTWPDQLQRENEANHQRSEASSSAIKEGTRSGQTHFTVGVQTVNIDSEETTMADKANACDDCGLLFDTPHDVQRHLKRGWCTESQDPPVKKRKLEDESESMDSIEDNDAYLHMWKLAKTDGLERYTELREKYMAQGEDEDDASDIAEARVKPYEEKNLLNRYSTLLETYWLPLQDNFFHTRVLGQIRINRY